MRRPDPQRSSALLIGTSRYQSDELPDLPSVHNNLSGLLEVLTDPVLGGLQPSRCEVTHDATDIRTVYRTLRQCAQAAEDMLLVYFAGHGRVGRHGELYLSLSQTDPDELKVSALPFELVRDAFADCRAANRILILDCCFSGMAISSMGGDIAGSLAVAGTYILTATPRTALALAPPGEKYTAFTGELLSLLNNGIADGPEWLTLDVIYPQLVHTMAERRMPQPQRQGSGLVEKLLLSRNVAFSDKPPDPPTAMENQPPDPGEPAGQDRAWTNRVRSLPVLVGLVVTVAVVVVTSVLLTRNGGQPVETPPTLVLEPAATPNPAAFAPDFRTAGAALPGRAFASSRPPSVAAAGTVSGDADGLYRSPRSSSVCDRNGLAGYFHDRPELRHQLVAELTSDPQVSIADLDTYLSRLIPVLLRADTRVTEHSFAAGRPTRSQVVLQAGTAVLVDDSGMPRLRCADGNPLSPPEGTPGETTGSAWPGYTKDSVVHVVPVLSTIRQFSVLDLDDKVFRRPAGTLGEADFEPVPENGSLERGYTLTSQQTECVNLTDCSPPTMEWVRILISNCHGNRCEVVSDHWSGAVALVRDGNTWRATGQLSKESGVSCAEVTTFTLTLTITGASVLDTEWAADHLIGSEALDSPEGECAAAHRAWSLTAKPT